MSTFTRETMPTVTEGCVRLAEYRDVNDDNSAIVTKIAQATAAVWGYPTATLAQETRGFVGAGSCARWQEARWSATYWSDGKKFGKSFINEAPCRAYFAELTDPEKVSARRQEDAMLEDTVYGPARVRLAAELAAQKQAEKERKSALAKWRRQAMKSRKAG